MKIEIPMIYLFLLIWRVHYETLDQWNILKLGHGLGVGPLSYGDTSYLHNNGIFLLNQLINGREGLIS
jgi:hypothetical protein